MTFADLPLLQAVYDVRCEVDQPGSESWTTNAEMRLKLTRLILDRLLSTADQTVMDAWILMRKSPTVDGRKKLDLIVEVSRRHGDRCFYAGRGKGDCSTDVQLDRILPESRGGKYTLENCILACGRHNAMRGDKLLEEFLLSPS